MHATNDGVSLLFIHALSENAAMLKIARNAGARMERDGTESEAFLHLPQATLDSQVTELIEEQVAQTDYRIKVQAMLEPHSGSVALQTVEDMLEVQRGEQP